MGAFVGIHLKCGGGRIVFFESLDEVCKFLLAPTTRHFHVNHLVGGNFVKSQPVYFEAHFLQTEVLPPQLIDLPPKDIFQTVFPFYQQALCLFVNINFS